MKNLTIRKFAFFSLVPAFGKFFLWLRRKEVDKKYIYKLKKLISLVYNINFYLIVPIDRTPQGLYSQRSSYKWRDRCWSFTKLCEGQVCLGRGWRSKSYHFRWSPNYVWSLNYIEKIFHIIKLRLCQDALDRQKTKCDFGTFSRKVKNSLGSIPIDLVDRTILPMGKRIKEIIKQKGQRMKYILANPEAHQIRRNAKIVS